MEEVWKDVPNFPGYQVSNFGRMRSFRPSGGRYSEMRTTPIILKSCPNSKGYPIHTLSINGNARTKHLHLMVIEIFGPPKPPGTECSHVNGNKSDCSIDNLCWETHIDNMQRQFLHGTAPIGEANPRSKLKREQALEIRRRRAIGEKLADLAHEFHVSIPTVWGIATGKHWK